MTDSARTAAKKRGLKAAVAEAKEQAKGQDGVTKRQTSLKTAKLADAASDAGVDTGITRPTDEQLAAINSYTRSPKMADEVAVFTTLSCNDLEDRDEDKFTTETVKGFAELAVPYGPNGKSYMVGHDYTKLPVGRIFGTDTAEVEGALFMTNQVYVPNTPQYQTFLENQDYGIYWAVSVGVMLDENVCSVCDATMSQWGGFCYEGHYKGSYYDPSGEMDKYGYPLERKEGDKGVVKCIGLMKGARDFFELSQVFLGAQFYAELSDKSPAMAGVIKAAGAKHIPIIGLSSKEAAALPSLAPDPQVAEALKRYDVEHDEDGDMRWTADDGFRYVFVADKGEVQCLGKSPAKKEGTDGSNDEHGRTAADDAEPHGDADAEQPDASGREPGEPGADSVAGSGEPGGAGKRAVGDLTDKVAAARVRIVALAAAATPADTDAADDTAVTSLVETLDSLVDDAEQHLDDGDYSTAETTLNKIDDAIDELASELGIEFDDPDEADDNKKAVNGDMSKKAVLTAAVKASVPASILTKVSEASDNGLDVLLGALTGHNRALEAEKAALAPKAAMGDAYIKAVRDEALEWYIRANTDGTKGVKVETFNKVLDACGENVELVQELRDEQKKAAQARFGVSTLRTTAVEDPHERPALEGLSTSPSDVKHGSDARVRRLHG